MEGLGSLNIHNTVSITYDILPSISLVASLKVAIEEHHRINV